MILALSGPAGVGKSTLARILSETYNFERVRCAHILKAMIRVLLIEQGLDNEKILTRIIDGDLKEQPQALLNGKSSRLAQQTLGTEWGRTFIDNDLWIDATIRKIDSLTIKGRNVVVDDMRFKNEEFRLRRAGAIAIQLDREGFGPGSHPSELEYLTMSPELKIFNPGNTETELLYAFYGAWSKHFGITFSRSSNITAHLPPLF